MLSHKAHFCVEQLLSLLLLLTMVNLVPLLCSFLLLATTMANGSTRRTANTSVTPNTDSSKTTTVATGELKNLRKDRKAFEQLRKKYDDLNKQMSSTCDNLDRTKAELIETKNALVKSNEKKDKLEKETEEKDTLIMDIQKEIQEIKQQNKELTEQLDAAGDIVPSDDDLNDELVGRTEEATKILFRTWKFCEDKDDIISAVKEVIPYLKVPLTMTEPEYIQKYKHKVYQQLGKCRSYVQSEGKKRAQGKQLFQQLQRIFSFLT